MNIYERSLKAMEELLTNTSDEKLLEDSARLVGGVGPTVEEFLNQDYKPSIHMKYIKITRRAYSLHVDGETYSDAEGFEFSSSINTGSDLSYELFTSEECSNDDPYNQALVA